MFFVFGDLLLDFGNNNFIRMLLKVDFLLNGIDFFGGFVIGRYCNGCIIVDIFGNFRMYYKFYLIMFMLIVIVIYGIRLVYILYYIVLFCRLEGWKVRVFGIVFGI